MKKIAWAIAIIVLILLVIYGLSNGGSKETSSLKIGVDFPLTGNAAKYGEWGRNAITIAVEEANSTGGVNGSPVQAVFEDNQGQPASAVSAYQKMKSIDGINVVMTLISSIALAVQKPANQDKIIQMDISATTPLYSTANDYSFRTGIVATQLAKESAGVLMDQFKAKNVAILSINNDFGKGMIDVFKSSFTGKIVSEQTFNQDGTDFRTQLSNLKSRTDTDYIFLVGHFKEAGLLVKQARELGIDTLIISDVYSVEGPDFLENAGKSAEGLVYLGVKFDVNDTSPAVSKFVGAYKTKYKDDPTIYAAQTYDGTVALIEAYRTCKSIDNECVKEQLMSLDFQGASGRIKFDTNGDVVKQVELKTIKDGKFVKL